MSVFGRIFRNLSRALRQKARWWRTIWSRG